MSSKLTSTYSLETRPISLYHCGRERCKPSHSFGPAIRPHYLFHYILKGKGTYYVDHTAYHLKKGNGFLIKPGVTTLYAADEEDPWEYCWVGFDGTQAKTVLQTCGFANNNLIFTDKSNGAFSSYMVALIQDFAEGNGNEYSYMGQLYLCFSAMYSNEHSDVQIHETYILKALDYIHHNYTYEIRISDLANYVSIDRTYLYKLFMTYQGVSPQQYLIQYRLTIAGELLMNSDLNVTEIAYSCGFKDAPSFNKHFKKYFKMPPLQYRLAKHFSNIDTTTTN